MRNKEEVKSWPDLTDFANKQGLPEFTSEEWTGLTKKYNKKELNRGLAEHIIKHNVEFPFNTITKEQMETLFNKLSGETQMGCVTLGVSAKVNVAEKFDYARPFTEKGVGVIKAAPIYNNISNYFAQKERLKCDSVHGKSPVGIWNDPVILRKHNFSFGSTIIPLTKDGLDGKDYRTSFRLNAYTASQFKPNTCKAIYELYQAEVICDPCCGWGDRLTAFYATPGAKCYYGTDPNTEMFEIYKEMAKTYESLLSGGGFFGVDPVYTEGEDWFQLEGEKLVKIFNRPAEDVDWKAEGCKEFDLSFTSPPYFDVELYGQGSEHESEQSWKRYNNFLDWESKFYQKMLINVYNNTKTGGVIAQNITDTKTKGGVNKICDRLIDFLTYENKCTFEHTIGMTLMMRPTLSAKNVDYNFEEEENVSVLTDLDKDVDSQRKTFIEPVWIFYKQ